MSATLEQRSEGTLPAAFPTSDDALSELGDGSSSLSDIEDKEAEQEDLDGLDSENDIESDVNDSEAETERLENSPHDQRKQKDVVLSSQAESRTYERSPSKLQHQFHIEAEDDEDEDMDDLSDDEGSFDKSPKSLEGAEQGPTTATTSLEDSSGEGKESIMMSNAASKKRKRSLLPDHGSMNGNDLDEPARKRTGSVGAPEDEYAIDDSASLNGDAEISNPISGNVSDVESLDAEDDEEGNPQGTNEDIGVEDGVADAADLADMSSPEIERHKGRKKRRGSGHDPEEVGAEHGEQANEEPVPDRLSHQPGDVEEPEDPADVEGEGDEAEVILRNEEEQEKKRVAMNQLSDIERRFASFRDRLYEDRLAQLDAEEAMLRQEKPTHPDYLAMLQCVDARRDEKLRIEARLMELRLETLHRSAVGKRSQILAQFFQDVREIRERKLEVLGKQWYEIQHDRRGYGSSVEDYAIRFPARKSQQVMHQLAYNTEVSILSGVAKFVGFPAAPVMAAATAAEADLDLEKMHKLMAKHQSQRVQQGLLLPELVALRAATSTTGFKPAEEQFIEQTPWANPQHPSHAHHLQHQSLGQQPARMSSPFSVAPVAQTRRPSLQHPLGTPISGTFPGATQSQTNGTYPHGGRVSPLNPFNNGSISQKVAPSPLGSRQTSLSPQQSKLPASLLQRQERLQEYAVGISRNQMSGNSPEHPGVSPDFSKAKDAPVDRDHSVAVNGQF